MEESFMDTVIGFNDLKVGQRVKVKGNSAEGNRFSALEVVIKPQEDGVAVEGKVQEIFPEMNKLRLMHREIAIVNGAEILDLKRDKIGLSGLQAGQVVKVKGTYSAANGLVPKKIKMQEPRALAHEELQGIIDRIDARKMVLDVLGFTVEVNDKTEIDGF
jgi:hypothetical protein